MPYIDLLILVIIAVFAGKGFVKGFFNEFLTFMGFIVAFFISTNLYKPVGGLIASLLHISQSFGRFAAYLILFLSIVFAFAVVGRMLSKGAKKLNVSGVNRTLGAVFGGAKGALGIGVILTVLMKGAVSPGLSAAAKNSVLTPFVIRFFDEAMKLFSLV